MDLDPQGAPAQTLQPLSRFSAAARARVRGVLFDIDDTLTTEGRLTATAYAAMERLHEAGLLVVPITGRPAGWCDHIARMWPVDAVVGENGAFYFLYDEGQRTMARRYWKNAEERAADRRRLADLGARTHLQRLDADLDLAARQVRVDRLRLALDDRAGHRDHALHAHRLELGDERAGDVDHALGQAEGVAQVDE
jgi:hypothetical protein